MNRTHLALLALLCGHVAARAETGYDGWLRYAPLDDAKRANVLATLPAVVVPLGDSEVEKSAVEELVRGVREMTGRTLRIESEIPDGPAIFLATFAEVNATRPDPRKPKDVITNGVDGDGYSITLSLNGSSTHITGVTERGILYGVFALLREIAERGTLAEPNMVRASNPYAPIRVLNHWDNLDGSIERGYAGKSIFWDNGHVTKGLRRVRDYARLMVSVGINGCSVNNVNADQRVVTPEYLREVEQIAAEFRKWDVKTYISLNSPAPATSAASKPSIRSILTRFAFGKRPSTRLTKSSPTWAASH